MSIEHIIPLRVFMQMLFCKYIYVLSVCYQVWFVLVQRRLIVDTWWLSREMNMKLVTQFITFARKPSFWMDQIKWLVYLMGHGAQSLLAEVRKAGNNTIHSHHGCVEVLH